MLKKLIGTIYRFQYYLKTLHSKLTLAVISSEAINPLHSCTYAIHFLLAICQKQHNTDICGIKRFLDTLERRTLGLF